MKPDRRRGPLIAASLQDLRVHPFIDGLFMAVMGVGGLLLRRAWQERAPA